MDDFLLWTFRLFLYLVGLVVLASPMWVFEDGVNLGVLLLVIFIFILYALAFAYFECFVIGEADLGDDNWFTYVYYSLGFFAVVLFFVLIVGFSWLNDIVVFS
jgi:hypothetical protein